MAVLKRATQKLQQAGIMLEVHKGIYGPYLRDPRFKKQTSKVYKTVDEAIHAALAGERPEEKE